MGSAKQGGSFSPGAYAGDHKTLLAFDFSDPADAKQLAGFTIECKPPGQPSYYLLNQLQFQNPSDHAQVAGQDPRSTINAPIQKYRWTHVPGTSYQGVVSAVGDYMYTVTPRYFDGNQRMQPLDSSISASVTVPVTPFRKGALALGFTRGYMQSQAFVRHFGTEAQLQPADRPLLYDTTQKAGTNAAGQNFTFANEYEWMGASARQQIFALLNAVLSDQTLKLKVFAYDLNEPDVLKILLALGKAGRVQIILDNASLHVSSSKKRTPEDEFTDSFTQSAKPPASVVRGCFARYSHDKICIVLKDAAPTQVLTGSTNFSVTGLYVNANHVLVFDDANVAGAYDRVFDESWQLLKGVKTPSQKVAREFSSTSLATKPYTYWSTSVPKIKVTFSPHSAADAKSILAAISTHIQGQASVPNGSALFAVMQLTGSETPVYNTLKNLFGNMSVYSYGISDSPGGTHLYAPGSKKGVLVTGKPGKTTLPPPFDQVPSPLGHEIHDKFVVCGLNSSDPVVYCGSSNLASGGEQQNGDNLLEIHDADVATAFAIEALLLVDHYNFLDRYAHAQKSGGAPKPATKPAGKNRASRKPK